MKVNETFTIIFLEYSNLVDVFSPKLVVELANYIRINNHIIYLINNKQPFCKLIYSPEFMELKILTTYIKINLANYFIIPLKSFVDAPIFFVWKFDNSFCLYVNYQGLNNVTIKNQYLLFLIYAFLNWLSWAKQFTELNLTSAYFQMRICKRNQ